MSNGNAGWAIILNGPSSAGKTSIQRALQDSLEQPVLATGIDDFHVMLPERFLSEDTPDGQGINIHIGASDGHRTLAVEFGPAAQKVIHGMHRSIAALIDTGNCVVVDHIFYDPSWRSDLDEALQTRPFYVVGVHCPLAELERREQARATEDPTRAGIIGHARSHYATVHAEHQYDLELDSSRLSPRECAQRIIKSLLH